ncbi:hypothetical protein CYMTET_38494, partial [Cymbomonas tetramitiformis]
NVAERDVARSAKAQEERRAFLERDKERKRELKEAEAEREALRREWRKAERKRAKEEVVVADTDFSQTQRTWREEYDKGRRERDEARQKLMENGRKSIRSATKAYKVGIQKRLEQVEEVARQRRLKMQEEEEKRLELVQQREEKRLADEKAWKVQQQQRKKELEERLEKRLTEHASGSYMAPHREDIPPSSPGNLNSSPSGTPLRDAWVAPQT